MDNLPNKMQEQKRKINKIKGNEQNIKGEISEILTLKDYSEKDAETMYEETLEKLKGTFNIPKDLSNIVVRIWNIKDGIFIDVRGDSINATVDFGYGKLLQYSINKKTNSYGCTRIDDYEAFHIDVYAIGHKTKKDIISGIDDAVDAIIKNKRKCTVKIKDEKQRKTRTSK